MPELMTILIPVNFKENGVVEILQNTINECGCVSLLTESERHGLPIERIRSALSSMVGVTCDDKKCCITNLTAFSENMKKLAGGE